MMHYLLILLIGYLLGCSNMAVYLAAAQNVDLRSGGSGNPGEILECDKRFVIACGSGAVMLTEVQLESKKRMSAEDLLRGFKPEKNEVLPN